MRNPEARADGQQPTPLTNAWSDAFKGKPSPSVAPAADGAPDEGPHIAPRLRGFAERVKLTPEQLDTLAHALDGERTQIATLRQQRQAGRSRTSRRARRSTRFASAPTRRSRTCSIASNWLRSARCAITASAKTVDSSRSDASGDAEQLRRSIRRKQREEGKQRHPPGSSAAISLNSAGISAQRVNKSTPSRFR